MHGEGDQEMRDLNASGLDRAEALELQAQLDADEWTALLAVQHAFANAPTLSPSSGFGDRVLHSLAVRQRRQARRRELAGIIAFAFGSNILTAFVLWLSPLGALTGANGWADLLNTFASFVGVMQVVLEIAGAFAQVIPAVLGGGIVLALALLALVLTILWTRIVVGWTPLNRPEFV